MRYIFTLILLVLLQITTANAQFFQTGQDPSRIKWKQINTDHFQVIYPQEFDKEAQRLAYILTKVVEFGSLSIDHTPKKISVVLHTRTANSNGLVAWAPRRMELFTTPNQQMYPQEWLTQLALHESRHLVQMDKIRSELPGLLKVMLGEQATALVTGVYLPLWFLEGDAVVNETALSQTGRGRSAAFSMQYRALLHDKGLYPYNKAYLGSYKDFVPDYYQLGYWMVAQAREKYGPQLWSDILERTGSQPFSLTPFNSVLKRKTGMNRSHLYRQVFGELSQDWQKQMGQPVDEQSFVSPKRKSYTNYRYPSFYRDSLILAYRTSMDDIGRIVMIHPNGREEKIYTPGTVYDEFVSFRNQLIIWAERQPDIRWEHADRSVISIYDVETKSKRRLSFENKLFSPAISPDLKSFAAIECDNENNYYLSVYDITSGELKQRFRSEGNQYLFTPCWDDKGEMIYTVRLSPKGKYIVRYDLITERFQQFTPMTFGDIKNPVLVDNHLLFSADISGKDDLYALSISDGQIYHICSPAFGADFPSAMNSRHQILYSNYTSDGYRLCKLDMKDQSAWHPVTDMSLKPNTLADHLTAQEKGIPDLKAPDTLNYSSSDYSKAAHLFNFHSWAPAYIDVDNYEIRPGVSLLSQNVLGTAETRIGYDYDVTNQTGKYELAFNYYGWFPQFTSTLSYGNGRSSYYQVTNTYDRFNNVTGSDTIVNRYNWHELDADLGVRLPLNLSRGKYSIGLYPEVDYKFSYFNPEPTSNKNIQSGYYNAFSYRLYHYTLLRQAAQQLMPKWGYQLDMMFRHTPFGDFQRGNIKGIQTNIYLPGLLKNNGIRIYQGYQQKDYHAASGFSNFVHFPRGIRTAENNKMYSLSADYKMPLLYPDASVGKFLYLKRIRTSLFYDYAWLSAPAMNKKHEWVPDYYQYDVNSTGMDLTADIHILRFYAPIQVGLRTVYLPQTQKVVTSFLFSVDFNGF